MKIYKCCKCNFEGKLKEVKHLKVGTYCKKCYRELRKKKRENIIKIFGIKKTNPTKPQSERKQMPEKTILPKIKGSKERKTNGKISALGLYLTKEEKQERYKQFIRNGLSPSEADRRVKKLSMEMRELTRKIKLNSQNKKEESRETDKLNKKFKEEYLKLIGK